MGWREMCKFLDGIFLGEMYPKKHRFRPKSQFLGEMYLKMDRFRPKCLVVHFIYTIFVVSKTSYCYEIIDRKTYRNCHIKHCVK